MFPALVRSLLDLGGGRMVAHLHFLKLDVDLLRVVRLEDHVLGFLCMLAEGDLLCKRCFG